MTNENGGFSYNYSAAHREEIKNIRSKYLPQEEDKLAQLRRLDAGVTQKGTALSLAAGIIGTLVLGIGMCCCMVWGGQLFIPGIVIGLVGIAVVAGAYPIYNAVTAREREKIAPEILRLTDELMQ